MTEPTRFNYYQRALCPEASERASMTDEEFWSHVFPAREEEDYGPSSIDVDDITLMQGTPCLVCGVAIGACGYDAEDRPWIHVFREED